MSQLIYREEYKNDDRPLVEIIAGQFGGRLYSHENWIGKQYCIQDWVWIASGRTLSWEKNIKPKMQGQHAIEGRLHTSEHSIPIGNKGDSRKADFCEDEGLYYITQFMPSSSTVNDVKQFLAKAGVLVDTIRREPDSAVDLAWDAYRMQGREDDWIDARLKGKKKRKLFTQALSEAIGHQVKKIQYGTATDNVYLGLWKRTSANLKEQLGLSPKSRKLRDNQPKLGLLYQMIAEDVCTTKLKGKGDDITWSLADSIIREVAGLIGKQARETGRILDTDLATGKLLSENPSIKRLYND